MRYKEKVLFFITTLLILNISWLAIIFAQEQWSSGVGATACCWNLEDWTASMLPSRPTIVIGNDGQFTSTNGVVGGSGSESDPYIIEKLVIDASSQDGIYNLGPLIFLYLRFLRANAQSTTGSGLTPRSMSQ
jgi:hypothetical protein